MPQRILALPQNPSVESGSVSFESPDQSTLNIHASDQAVINFSSFDIAANETVQIFQPSAQATLLNRIQNAASATNIFGNLFANGIVFLVNSQGINFGPTANIQAAGFVASTLDISTQNFLDKRYIFEHELQNTYAKIVNQGRIAADNIALIASSVENAPQGLLVAQAGTVALASGDKVTVSFDQNNLINVEVNAETSGKESQSIVSAVTQAGTIEAKTVVMTAKTASDLFEQAVNHTGITRATGMIEENGTIRVVADKTIAVSGQLEAPSGNIHIESTQGSVVIPKALTLIGETTITSQKQDILIQSPVTHATGTLALYAPFGSILNSSGVPIRGPNITLAAQNISSQVDTPVLSVWRNADNMHLTSSTLQDGLVTLEGDGVFVVYPVITDLTLQSNNTITTEPGVILQANTIKLISNKFGTTANPVNILADYTYIQRLSGNIDIAYSQIFGDQVLVRGPPDLGAIIYSANTNLTLEAPNGHLSLASNTTLASTSGFIILKTNKGNIDIYGTILAPQGTVTLWTCGNIDVRQATIISKNGGFIYNPDDTISTSWDGGGDGITWADPLNWGGDTVPNDANYVVTIDFASAAVTTSAAYTIGSLTIGGTQTCSLTLDGNLTTSTANGATGDLTIATGGTLSAGSYTITVAGNLDTNTGTFTQGTSTVILTGTGTLNSAGDFFWDLTVGAATKTTTITSRLNVQHVLTIADSTGVLTDGGGGSWNIIVTGTGTPFVNNGAAVTCSKFIYRNSTDGLTITAAGGTYNVFNSLLFGGGSITTVTYQLNGNLVVNGTLSVAGEANFQRSTLDTSGSNYSVTANSLSLGTSALQAGDFHVNGSSVTINGNVTLATGGAVIIAGSSNWTVSGDWSNGGSFTANTSTVTFNGTTDQTITTNSQPFYNLTLNNTGASGSDDIIISGALDVNNLLTITDGDLDISTNDPNVNIAGGMTIGANGSIDLTAYAGTWTYDGSGTLTDNRVTLCDLGTFTINGTAATLTLGSSVKVTNITVGADDTLNLGAGSYTLTITGTGTPLTITTGGTFNKGTGSTVNYTGSGTTTNIATVAYNNLTLAPASATATIYSLTGDLTGAYALSGNLNISNGWANLDATGSNYNLTCVNVTITGGYYTARGSTITASGNWTSSAGFFTFGTSTVVLNGDGTLNFLNLAPNFYNLTVGAAGKTTTFTNNLTVSNVLTIDAGALTDAYLGYTITVTGTGTGFSPVVNNGIITCNAFYFSPASAGTITVSGGTYEATLYIRPSLASNITFTLASDITVYGNTYIYNNTANYKATLDTANHTIYTYNLNVGSTSTKKGELICGSSSITVDGDLTVIVNSTITANTSTWDVRSAWLASGTFNGNTSLVTLNGSPNIFVLVNSNVSFYNLTIAGSYSLISGSLNVGGNWSNTGTFNLGSYTVTFNGTSGIQTVDAGTSNFGNVTINNTGSGVQLINNNLTQNTGCVLNFTKGTLDLNGKTWTLGANFAPAPTSAATLSINGGFLSGASYNMTLNNANMTVTHASGTITVQDFSYTAGTFTCSGTSAINASGNVVITSSWTNTGSTLTMSGASKTLNASQALNNLTITGTISLLTNNLDVDGAFSLQTGSFNANSLNQNFAGNFSLSSGTTFTKGGTLTFDGTTAATYTDSTAGIQNLGTVVLNKTDTVLPSTNDKLTLQSAMTADSLTIDGTAGQSDTLDVGSNTLTVTTLSNSGLITTSGNGSNLSIGSSNLGNVTFSNAASSLASKTYATLTLGNGGTTSGSVSITDLALTGTLNIAANNLTVSGSISGTGLISTSGTGFNLTLPTNAGNVTFTADATNLPVKTYGALILNQGGTLGSGTTTTTGLTLASNKTLTVGGNNLTVTTTLSNSGSIVVSSGAVNIPSGATGTFEYTAGRIVPSYNYTTLKLSEASGSYSIGNVNIGTLNLSGNGTLTADSGITVTTLQGNGIIQTANNGSGINLPSGANVTFTANATALPANTYLALVLQNGGSAQGNITATTLNITAGTFVIGANTLTVTGTLTLNSGATLSLSSGANTAASLVLNNVNKASGTWGTTGSGATHINDTYFSGTGVLNVTSGPTSTTIVITSGSPSTYGDSVTFTATVSGAGGTPTGTVTFKDGATTLGTGILNGFGVATFSTSTLSSASHTTITVSYPGDDNFGSSVSSNLTQTVNPASLSITASDQTKTYGDSSLGISAFTSLGLQNGETIGSVTFNTNASLSTSNNYTVGTWTITPSAATGGTFTAANYNITYNNAPVGLTVNPKALTVSGVSSQNKIYDGSITAALNVGSAALVGKISGDIVTLDTNSAAGAFADKNAGNSKAVTVSGLAISAADSANYTLAQPTGLTADITPMEIESSLYHSFPEPFMFTAPMNPFALMPPLISLALTPTGMPIIVPMAVVPAPFKNVSSSAAIVQPIDKKVFLGASSSNILPMPAPTPVDYIMVGSQNIWSKAAAFKGVGSKALLPQVVSKDYFSQAQGSSYIPASVTPEIFQGAASTEELSRVVIKEDFRGIHATSQLTSVVLPERFAGAVSQSSFAASLARPSFEGASAAFQASQPVNPLVFEKALGEARVQVMFPQGVKIMPTYNIGMPLGTEKPLLEPRIQAGGNREGFSGEKKR